MKKYRIELVLSVVFMAVLLAYCNFVSTPKLTSAEVDEYVKQIDKGLQMPEPMRSEFLMRVRAWGEADDGKAVYLANIFHFNDSAEMEKAMWPGLDITPAADGSATHDIYLEAVKDLIIPEGVWPSIGTLTQEVGGPNKSNLAGFSPESDNWSEININRYPGRRTILKLFSNPTYLEVMPYKLVGLKLLTVPTDARFVMPDLRLALGTVLLVIFMSVGWVRSILRQKTKA